MPSLDIIHSLSGIDSGQWNALVGADDPFFEYGFLSALEDSGCVGEETPWQPRYLVLRDEGVLHGAIPFYVKWDSYGEFIFDWQWADAYSRSGIPYYPKAVTAIPFTPVTGNRILVHPAADFDSTARALAKTLLATVSEQGLSGLHFLFTTEREHNLLAEYDVLPRISHQFHWFNRGYGCFDDFLADLRSNKRKNIRKERRQVADSGIEIEVLTGERILDSHMDAMWRFYLDTHSRKWGSAYLNRECFDLLLERCRDNLLLVMARDGQRWVGGTLNFVKGRRIYGRYWGAGVHLPCLHFECCFYRLIDYAIEHELEVVEAGAQGEHKFLRGFSAVPMYSNHWIAHASGRAAIGGFLAEESRQNLDLIASYNASSPLKRLREEAAQAAR